MAARLPVQAKVHRMTDRHLEWQRLDHGRYSATDRGRLYLIVRGWDLTSEYYGRWDWWYLRPDGSTGAITHTKRDALAQANSEHLNLEGPLSPAEREWASNPPYLRPEDEAQPRLI